MKRRSSVDERNPKVVSARDRIVDTATRLFYEEGSRAVGIDAVIAKSGVAKMSLYRNFRSKDELIAACLEKSDDGYWKWFDAVVAKHQGDPTAQIRAVVRGIAKRTVQPWYRGCLFLNTASDYSDRSNPGRKRAVRHKKTLAVKLLGICREMKIRDPKALARQLMLLINGAQATAGILGRATQMELIEAADRLMSASGVRRL